MNELKVKLESLILELCATNSRLWDIERLKYKFVSDGKVLYTAIKEELQLRQHRAKLINEINLCLNTIAGLHEVTWHDLCEIPNAAYDIIQRTANISIGRSKQTPKYDRVDSFRGFGQTVDECCINALKYANATIPEHREHLKFEVELGGFLMECIIRKAFREHRSPCLTIFKVY